MIIQEIKLHPEPVVVTYTPPTTPVKQTPLVSATGNILPFNPKPTIGTPWTYLELQEEQKRAYDNGIKVGTKWRFPHSQTWIEVVGWQLTPAYTTSVDNSPCIVKGKRKSPVDLRDDLIFNYSVDEILEMEIVND